MAHYYFGIGTLLLHRAETKIYFPQVYQIIQIQDFTLLATSGFYLNPCYYWGVRCYFFKKRISPHLTSLEHFYTPAFSLFSYPFWDWA